MLPFKSCTPSVTVLYCTMPTSQITCQFGWQPILIASLKNMVCTNIQPLNLSVRSFSPRFAQEDKGSRVHIRDLIDVDVLFQVG